jgi:glycosyltransferase involved in cell wall biosynthesis
MRKGADRAVALATVLNDRGLRTTLTVVGCEPPPGLSVPDYVSVRGYVSKADPYGVQRIDALLRESHFLAHAARADYTPVVLSEAASRALPAVATAVGGIDSIIRDGTSGRCFPPDTFVEDAAAFVLETLPDRDRYDALAWGSYDEYERRLNWTTSGRRVKELIDRVVEAA